DSLVEALKKPDKHRANINGVVHDVTDADIIDMLSHVDPDAPYGKWIRCGMAVHEATDGTGYEIWDAWSKEGKKYPGSQALRSHWHSFGKTNDPVGLGTLAHYAREDGGWMMPVTFDEDTTPSESAGALAPIDGASEPPDDVDLLRPPGFVGDIARWINATSRYKRESLAVAAALYAVSSAGGMRLVDDLDGFTPNLFLFGVAGSATGKEHVFSCIQQLFRRAGIASALHGGIKSEQEIFRNLLDHQAAFYMLDEMGEVLQKLTTARDSGATAYLSGVIGQFMSIYTKADG